MNNCRFIYLDWDDSFKSKTITMCNKSRGKIFNIIDEQIYYARWKFSNI
jgi:hypothetical protein